MLRCMLCLHSSVFIFIWRPQLRLHRRTRTIIIIWLNQDRMMIIWSRWWGWSFHRLRLCHSRLRLCLWHHPKTAIMWTSSFLPNDNHFIDRISIDILISHNIPLSMHFQANQNKLNLSNYPEPVNNWLIDESFTTSSKAFMRRRSAQPRFVHNNIIWPWLPLQTLCHAHAVESVEGTGTTWRNRQYIASIAWRGHYDDCVFMWQDSLKVKTPISQMKQEWFSSVLMSVFFEPKDWLFHQMYALSKLRYSHDQIKPSPHSDSIPGGPNTNQDDAKLLECFPSPGTRRSY